MKSPNEYGNYFKEKAFAHTITHFFALELKGSTHKFGINGSIRKLDIRS